jgi:hypothetical protein
VASYTAPFVEGVYAEENYVPDTITGRLVSVQQHFVRFHTQEMADIALKNLRRIPLYGRMNADVKTINMVHFVKPQYDVIARAKLNLASELVFELDTMNDELARMGAVRDPVTGVPELPTSHIIDASYFARDDTLRAWKRARSVGGVLDAGTFEVLFRKRPAEIAALRLTLHKLYLQEIDIRLRLRTFQAIDGLDFVF